MSPRIEPVADDIPEPDPAKALSAAIDLLLPLDEEDQRRVILAVAAFYDVELRTEVRED